MCERFRWTTYDVTGLLTERWAEWKSDALAVATHADFRDFPRLLR
jgi:hypothetical protein